MKEKRKSPKLTLGHVVILMLALALVYVAIPKTDETREPEKGNPSDSPPDGYHEYSSRLQWKWNDIEGALATAKQEGKLVLVDFWASWCGWCAKADKEVFPQKEVEDIILSHFVPIKIDTDTYPQMQVDYGVRGLPTIVVLDVEGKVLGRIVGFRPAAELITLLQQFVGG